MAFNRPSSAAAQTEDQGSAMPPAARGSGAPIAGAEAVEDPSSSSSAVSAPARNLSSCSPMACGPRPDHRGSSWRARGKRSVVGAMKAPLRGAAKKVAQIRGKSNKSKKKTNHLHSQPKDSPTACSGVDTPAIDISEKSAAPSGPGKDPVAERESYAQFCRLLAVPSMDGVGEGTAEARSCEATFRCPAAGRSGSALLAVSSSAPDSPPLAEPGEDKDRPVGGEAVGDCVVPSLSLEDSADRTVDACFSGDANELSNLCASENGRKLKEHAPVNSWQDEDPTARGEVGPGSESTPPSLVVNSDNDNMMKFCEALERVQSQRAKGTVATPGGFFKSYSKCEAKLRRLSQPKVVKEGGENATKSNGSQKLVRDLKSDWAVMHDSRSAEIDPLKNHASEEMEDDCSIPSLSLEEVSQPVDTEQVSDIALGPISIDKLGGKEINDVTPLVHDGTEKEEADSVLAWGALGMILGAPAPSLIRKRSPSRVRLDLWDDGEEVSDTLPEIDKVSEGSDLSLKGSGEGSNILPDFDICNEIEGLDLNELGEAYEGEKPGRNKEAASSVLAWGAMGMILGSPAPKSVIRRNSPRISLGIFEDGDESGPMPEIEGYEGIASEVDLSDKAVQFDEIYENNTGRLDLKEHTESQETIGESEGREDLIMARGCHEISGAPIPMSVLKRNSPEHCIDTFDEGEESDAIPEIDGNQGNVIRLFPSDNAMPGDGVSISLNELGDAHNSMVTKGGKERADSVLAWGALGIILGAPAPKSVARRHSSRLSLGLFVDGEDCDSLPDINEHGNGAGLCLEEGEKLPKVHPQAKEERRGGAALECSEELDLNELGDTNKDLEIEGTKGCGKKGADSMLAWSALGMIMGSPAPKLLSKKSRRQTSQHLFDDGCEATADNLDGLLPFFVANDIVKVDRNKDGEVMPLMGSTPDKEKGRGGGMFTGQVPLDAIEETNGRTHLSDFPSHDGNVSGSVQPSSQEATLVASAILANEASSRAAWVRALKKQRREEVHALLKDSSLVKDMRERPIKEVKARYSSLISSEEAGKAHGKAAAAYMRRSPEQEEEKKE